MGGPFCHRWAARQRYHAIAGDVTQAHRKDTVILGPGAQGHLGPSTRCEHLQISYTILDEGARLEFCGGLGDPTVPNSMTVGGVNYVPGTLQGLTLAPVPPFRRGDANADGEIDIGDAITILGFLFGSEAPPKENVAQCLDAADANDSGAVDIADAITTLSHLFAHTGPLPQPFGECGIDPTSDDLDCLGFPPCE